MRWRIEADLATEGSEEVCGRLVPGAAPSASGDHRIARVAGERFSAGGGHPLWPGLLRSRYIAASRLATGQEAGEERMGNFGSNAAPTIGRCFLRCGKHGYSHSLKLWRGISNRRPTAAGGPFGPISCREGSLAVTLRLVSGSSARSISALTSSARSSEACVWSAVLYSSRVTWRRARFIQPRSKVSMCSVAAPGAPWRPAWVTQGWTNRPAVPPSALPRCSVGSSVEPEPTDGDMAWTA